MVAIMDRRTHKVLCYMAIPAIIEVWMQANYSAFPLGALQHPEQCREESNLWRPPSSGWRGVSLPVALVGRLTGLYMHMHGYVGVINRVA